jgi:hypothetical protein
LTQGSSVTKSCQYAGIARQTAYDWRYADEEFAKQWDDAVEQGTDRLEDEAFRRAHDGVQKPIVYQGQVTREDDVAYFTRIAKVVGDDRELLQKLEALSGGELDLFGTRIGVAREQLFVLEHSDTLLCKLLAARRETYRRTSSDVTVSNNGPLINQTTINVIQSTPVDAMRTYQQIMSSDE